MGITSNKDIKQVIRNQDLGEFNCMIDIYIYSSKDFVNTYKLIDIVQLTHDKIIQLVIYYIQLTYNLNSFQI